MTAIQEAADASSPASATCTATGSAGCASTAGSRSSTRSVSPPAPARAPGTSTSGKPATAPPSLATPGTAQIRRFAFNRGLAKIINQAVATPFEHRRRRRRRPARRRRHQHRRQFGIRSWSSHSLLTKRSLLDDSTALVETKRFAQFYVDNFKQPRNRITDIAFRTMRPGARGRHRHLGSPLPHRHLATASRSPSTSPAVAASTAIDYFVEGIHETARPLNPEYDDVELTLDLSARRRTSTTTPGTT